MKLKKNHVFKNLKEVGIFLEKDIKTKVQTNTKKSWLKELDTLCEWHKEGQKYIVDKVFRNQKEKVDGRGKYESNNKFGTNLDEILKYHFQHEKEIKGTYLNIVTRFGIIRNLYKEYRDYPHKKKKFLYDNEIRNNTYNSYCFHMNTLLHGQLDYTLNRLQKENVIKYNKYYMCYTSNDSYVELDISFNDNIKACKIKTEEETEMNMIEAMMIGGSTLKQYNEIMKKYLNDDKELLSNVSSSIEYVLKNIT